MVDKNKMAPWKRRYMDLFPEELGLDGKDGEEQNPGDDAETQAD